MAPSLGLIISYCLHKELLPRTKLARTKNRNWHHHHHHHHHQQEEEEEGLATAATAATATSAPTATTDYGYD